MVFKYHRLKSYYAITITILILKQSVTIIDRVLVNTYVKQFGTTH